MGETPYAKEQWLKEIRSIFKPVGGPFGGATGTRGAGTGAAGLMAQEF